MKKTLYLLAIIAVTFACSSSKEESQETTEPEADSVFSYSGSFEIGPKANQELVRNLLDAFEAKDAETMGTLFADSVSFYWSDGSMVRHSRDSAVAMATGYLNSLTGVDVVNLAGMAVTSKDTGDEWGLSWTLENHISENGENTSVLQESYLIRDGKITSLRQYRQVPNEADAGGSNDEGESGYTYSGSFEMGDSSLIGIVLEANKSVETPMDLSGIDSQFADSVTIIGSNGYFFNSTRDSLKTMSEEWFSTFTSLKFDFVAGFTVHSVDRDEDWVLIWYQQDSENKEGETFEAAFHEDYLMEDGKIRLIRSYQMGGWPDNDDEESSSEEGEES